MRKNIFKRYIRGVSYIMKSVFWERPRGLDFSLRQKYKEIFTAGNHGYALTPPKAFNNIMSRIQVNPDDAFIDIGCGKGGCLLYASKYFNRVAGIEIEDKLYEIAVKNFEKLKMPQIEIFHDNAISFDKYGQFNIFYLFNPFDADIYQQVLDRIISTLNEKREGIVYLICYGDTFVDEMLKGKMNLVDKYMDRIRDARVSIWRWDNIQNTNEVIEINEIRY